MIPSASKSVGPARRAVEKLKEILSGSCRVGREAEKGNGSSDIVVAIAPGRVNLLGGHADYNEGFVLPIAIDRYVACAMAPDDSGTIEFVSIDYDDNFTIGLSCLNDVRNDRDEFERLVGGRENRWRRYVTGVILEMEEAGMSLDSGLAVIAGNLVIGSGLSSSAALEAAVYTAFGKGIPATPETALLCQRAENRWVGVPCGIMDQFTGLLAEEGKVLFLDCRHLTFENITLPRGSAFTVVDSGIGRELADGEYLRRRLEIESALEIIRKVAGPIGSLRDLPPDDFHAVEDLLPDILQKRVKHVVGAIERVPKAVAHLALGEVEKFGELMTESHRSLAELYDVSLPELDIIVESALKTDGVYGARLTGAGFGGCSVIIHREGCEEMLMRNIMEAFETRFGSRPGFHHLRTASGASILEEESDWL